MQLKIEIEGVFSFVKTFVYFASDSARGLLSVMFRLHPFTVQAELE